MFFSTAHAQSRLAQTATENSQEGLAQFFSDFFAAVPLWIAAAVVFVVSIFLGRALKKIISFRLAKRQVHQEVLILVERAVFAGVIILGLIISFKIVGIDIATLFGFMGLGIGLALKDFLSNFIAGVLILTQKKFKIGDIVSVDGKTGTIKEIDSRATEILSFDGTNLIIPNATMLNAVVENFTSNTFRRVSFQVGVHYATPLETCIQTTLDSIKKNEFVIPDPAPSVWASEFGDSAITLDVKFWVESTANRFLIKSQIIQALKKDYDARGIEIPYPIRTLTLDDNDSNLMNALHLPSKQQKAAQLAQQKAAAQAQAAQQKQA